MNAAIQANPYAIGPSLHDFAWDKWEKQERMREARDAAFEDHFNLWRRFSYLDREKKKAREEIAEVMSEALSDLYGNEKDGEAFDQILFAWYCNKDSVETTNALYELLDKYIQNAARKEWERAQQKAA